MSVVEEMPQVLQDFLAPELREIRGRLDAVDKRFDAVDKRFDTLDKRHDEMNTRI